MAETPISLGLLHIEGNRFTLPFREAITIAAGDEAVWPERVCPGIARRGWRGCDFAGMVLGD